MTPLEEKLVRRLVFQRGSLSRNKNFDTFEHAGARRARRIAARIESLRAALRSAADDQVTIKATGDRWVLEIIDAANRLHRTSSLDESELRILCDDPVCAERLGRSPTRSVTE